jgi:hypothetical protein
MIGPRPFFYSLAAFFRNTTQKALDGNVKDGRGPIIHVPTDADRPRWQALPAEIQAATQATQTARAATEVAFEKWLATAKRTDLEAELPPKDHLARLGLDEGQGVPAGTKPTAPLNWQKNGRAAAAPVFSKDATLELGNVGDFGTKQAFSVSTWVRGPKSNAIVTLAARMDDARDARGWSLYQEGGNVGFYLIAKWPGDAIEVVSAKPVAKPDAWQHVLLSYDGSGKAAGVKIYVDGQRVETKAKVDKLASDVRAETPTRLGQRSQSQPFENGSLQDVRFYGRAVSGLEASSLAKVPLLPGLLAAKPDASQKQMLREHYLATRRSGAREAEQKLARLMAEQKAIRDRSPITHVQEERKDRMPMANILLRGAYDKLGDKVEAAVPAALGKLAADAPKNRLGLARWIISPENPLTTRVTVNRMWQEVFGTGLVKTSEDFGIMGALPSHPELLDWLAVDFRENGWDVKRFYRLILTSRTYRQAAVITPEKLEKDRDNTLFSRGPRFRMDAEMIRDYALAASGTLSPRMGGPGTKPYQPENIWEVVGVGIQPYRQDKGENLYRRSVYNYWRRMAPPASLELFNAPSREVSCVRRDRTNTPLQALVMMNDPQYVEASRQLAQRTLQAGARTAASLGYAGLLDAAAVRLLCRPLRDEEKAVLIEGLIRFRAHYQAHPADAEALLKVGDAPADPAVPKHELAAWTMVCSQLLNLDEVLNK